MVKHTKNKTTITFFQTNKIQSKYQKFSLHKFDAIGRVAYGFNRYRAGGATSSIPHSIAAVVVIVVVPVITIKPITMCAVGYIGRTRVAIAEIVIIRRPIVAVVHVIIVESASVVRSKAVVYRVSTGYWPVSVPLRPVAVLR